MEGERFAMIRNLAIMALILLTLMGCGSSTKQVKTIEVSKCVITKNQVMRQLSAGAQVAPADIETVNTCYPKIGGPHAVSALTDIEAAMARRLADQEVLEVTLVKSLGEMGNPESISVLFKVISTSPSVKVRAEAARSLGKIGGPSAKLVLQQRLEVETSPEVREALQKAIQTIKTDDGIKGPSSQLTSI